MGAAPVLFIYACPVEGCRERLMHMLTELGGRSLVGLVSRTHAERPLLIVIALHRVKSTDERNSGSSW